MFMFMFRYFWWGMCIALFSICLLFIRFSDVFKHEHKYVQNKKWWTRSCLDIFDGACASCCFLTLVAHLMFIHLWIASYSWPKEAKCRDARMNSFCRWAFFSSSTEIQNVKLKKAAEAQFLQTLSSKQWYRHVTICFKALKMLIF